MATQICTFTQTSYHARPHPSTKKSGRSRLGLPDFNVKLFVFLRGVFHYAYKPRQVRRIFALYALSEQDDPDLFAHFRQQIGGNRAFRIGNAVEFGKIRRILFCQAKGLDALTWYVNILEEQITKQKR